jgi:hypothetical protein
MVYSRQVKAVTGGGKIMSSIAIRTENSDVDTPRFRAVAGNRQSVGRTMGEALDALTADWGDDIQETAVFIQRFQPDAYFTAAQCCRMQELLARRATLTAEERAELETLIDAELDATVARTESLMRPRQP